MILMTKNLRVFPFSGTLYAVFYGKMTSTQTTLMSAGTAAALSILFVLPAVAVRPEKKLQRIVIPELDIQDVALSDFFEFITTTVWEADPEPDPSKKGLNFFLNMPEEDKARTVSYRGRNRAVRSIISDICAELDLVYHIEGRIVWINSRDRARRTMASRIYPVRPSVARGMVREGAQGYLSTRGVPFPEGAGARYDRRLSKLFLRNTPANLRRAETVLVQDNRAVYTHDKTRKPRLKGGTFENEKTWEMHGGNKDIIRLGDDRSDTSIPQRTQYARDRDTITDVMRLRMTRQRNSRVEKKLKRIIIPELDLQQTRFTDAVRLLEDIAMESDPSRDNYRGFHAILRIPEHKAAQLITFRATRISVMDALRSLAGVVGVTLELDGNRILFTAPSTSES
jgi:hypothetical protein